ncbi:MAG: DEAD/DEAH box helicase [Candidatus Sericytochromatia bacterium]
MTQKFKNLEITENILKYLEKINIVSPTEIQEKVIPIILDNKNVIGLSQTGTGKTLAYLLPIIQKIDLSNGTQTIILAPTHELASQIKTEIEKIIKGSDLNLSYALIIGEVNIKRQIDKLKEKPNIIVGSSGRILELIEKKKISTKNIKNLVLDESDRLLDIKNLSEVRKICSYLKDTQKILISAGMSESSIKIASEIISSDYEIIKASSINTIPSNIEHLYYLCDDKNKQSELKRIIKFLNPDKSLVFVQQSNDVEKLTTEFKYHGMKIGAIFGKQSKEERKKVLDDFRKSKIQILFSTDLLARGLDIQNITHVLNYNISKDSEAYLHRAGRTGRQNVKGYSISIVNTQEKKLLFKIAKELNLSIKQFSIESIKND